MSLLEDIFLRDETEEDQSLERIIEGDEFEHIQRDDSDNDSPKEDEAEEEKSRVDPTKPKRVVKNPRFTLNPARLTGPRGIQDIPEHFKNFKFKGKGHEKDDLDLVLKRLEHWAYRLYPKFGFHDCLKKIEVLGKKRPVMVHLHKIRSDQLLTDEPVVQQEDNSSEDEPPPQDEFDVLLQQQIDKARATPQQTPYTPRPNSSLSQPKAASSPSISDDQRERMIRNRKLAEERRLARLKASNEITQKKTAMPKDAESYISKETSPESVNMNKDNLETDEILEKINAKNEAKHVKNNEQNNKNKSINISSSEDSNDSTEKVDYAARINKLISSDNDDSNDGNELNINKEKHTKRILNKSINLPSSDGEEKIDYATRFDQLISSDNEFSNYNNDEITTNINNVTKTKNKKSNIITSDSEEEMDVCNQSIIVDVHTNDLINNVYNKKKTDNIVIETEAFDAIVNDDTENNQVSKSNQIMNDIETEFNNDKAFLTSNDNNDIQNEDVIKTNAVIDIDMVVV